KTNVFSPDFVGPARCLIENTLKCQSLFLQGCAGNINPVTGIGQYADAEPRVKEDMIRVGEMLGSEVIKIAQSMYTHRRRKEPVLVKSVAWYWLYENEAIVPGERGNIEVNEVELELPLAPFPAIREVEEERNEWAGKLQSAKLQDEREWVLGPLLCYDA